MKNRIFKFLILSLVLVLIFGAVSASAFESYDTYTYSIDGQPLKSPSAYDASQFYNSSSMGLLSDKFGGIALSSASDIVSSHGSTSQSASYPIQNISSLRCSRA